jgi:hypothetical protein
LNKTQNEFDGCMKYVTRLNEILVHKHDSKQPPLIKDSLTLLTIDLHAEAGVGNANRQTKASIRFVGTSHEWAKQWH